MAQNNSRSQNHDLAEGMTDGAWQKLLTGPDRGGLAEPTTARLRQKIFQSRYFGNPAESPVKIAPDGTRLV